MKKSTTRALVDGVARAEWDPGFLPFRADPGMRRELKFELPGHPRSWQRVRVDTRGAKPRFYNPDQMERYKAALGLFARKEMRGRELLQGPLALGIKVVFRRTNAIERDHPEGEEVPAGRLPDCDNISGIVSDALASIVFRNDCQVALEIVEKVYAGRPPRWDPRPRVEITIATWAASSRGRKGASREGD